MLILMAIGAGGLILLALVLVFLVWAGARTIRSTQGAAPFNTNQMEAVVMHHGGFGTTAAGLQAGIPAVVVPHIIDQFIWGQRLHELVVAPQPIARNKITAAKLAAALEQATGDQAMRLRSLQLGEQIRTEQGVQMAVRLIEASQNSAQPLKQPGRNMELSY